MARIKRITPLEAIRANKDVRIRAKEVKSPKIIRRLFGVEGMMADKNYKRDRKKYRATVFSLTVSIVLFTAATLFSSYMDMTGAFMLEAPEYELSYRVSDSELDEGEREEILGMMEQGEKVENVELHGEMYSLVSIPKEELSEEWSDLLIGEGLESYYNMTEEEARVYNEKISMNTL